MKEQKRSHKLLKHSLLTLALLLALGLFVTTASQPSYASTTQYITAPTLATPTITASASKGYDSAKIVWAAVEGATFYDVYYATSATGNYSMVGTSTTTSFTKTGLTTGKTYYFKVVAGTLFDTTNVYSSQSSYQAVTPIPATTVANAASASYTSIKVSWSAVDGATGYKVYRATSSTGAYASLGATANLSYTNTSLVTGKNYYYKVIAYKTVSGVNVNSKASAVVSAKPIPATPSCAVATKTSTSVKISWTSVPGGTAYQIYRSTGTPDSYSLVYTAASTLTSYVDTGLTNGTMYYYKVRAYHLEGTAKIPGSFSTAKSLTLGDIYSSGLYKVGRDIPAGDYMVVSTKTGYAEFSISIDSAGDNEIGYGYPEPNRYVTLVWGQYVNFDYCKIYPLAKAPTVAKNGDGNLISGQYKVGRDIEPGTYILIPNAGEDYSEFSIAKNALNFEDSEIAYNPIYGRCYVTVTDGQYLTVLGAVGYAPEDAPLIDTSNNYLQEDGMYLVGKDIPPGLYTMTGLTYPEIGMAMGMFEIYSDATYQEDGMVSMGYVFGQAFSVILEDGQYINLTNCRLDFPSPI